MPSNSVVYIPKGSITQIITHLKLNHYKVSDFDKYILLFLGHPQSGWINIGSQALNRAEFLHRLTISKAAVETITLIPGETSIIFLENTAKKLNLNKEKLLSELKRQSPYSEGVFYPETYKIPKGITEDLLIEMLLNYAQNSYKKISTKYLGINNVNDKTWRDIIIAASVIQKEAANNEEMQTVASVIYNRLKIGMKLQMDGTLNYGIYSHTKVTPQRIKEDNTFYNTYKFDGFPKEAVCNVSEYAIRAVIAEKKYIQQNQKGSTDYLYFVRDKSTGKHTFSTNLKDHNNAINMQR